MPIYAHLEPFANKFVRRISTVCLQLAWNQPAIFLASMHVKGGKETLDCGVNTSYPQQTSQEDPILLGDKLIYSIIRLQSWKTGLRNACHQSRPSSHWGAPPQDAACSDDPDASWAGWAALQDHPKHQHWLIGSQQILEHFSRLPPSPTQNCANNLQKGTS